MNLAVYTTIHPGTRPFLEEWFRSVRSQTDTDVSLWVGIDEVAEEEACSIMGGCPDVVHWVQAEEGDTYAQVRERAWRALIPHADAVVLTDADDVLLPGRVAHARRHLAGHDGVGCGLRLVGPEGSNLGATMPPDQYAHPAKALPEHNIFGLSNAAYRTDLLAACLPLPEDVVLIDWFLATQAWLRGASLSFDPTVQMKYRRHDENMLPLLPPFSAEEIRRTTVVVRKHFQVVEEHVPAGAPEERLSMLKQAARRAERFAERALGDPEWLEHYTEQLNRLDPEPLWWSCVAHPTLQSLWSQFSSPQ